MCCHVVWFGVNNRTMFANCHTFYVGTLHIDDGMTGAGVYHGSCILMTVLLGLEFVMDHAY